MFRAWCEFCAGLFYAQPAPKTPCPLSDPDCPERERHAYLAWLDDPDTRRLHHHQIRAGFALPCDGGCPRQSKGPEVRESLIEKIKARYRIEDMAERLTEMRWRGHRGMGRCPFHSDRSPSFSVDTDRQKWHCFAGCGHGDVIDLVRIAEERGLSVGL